MTHVEDNLLTYSHILSLRMLCECLVVCVSVSLDRFESQ